MTSRRRFDEPRYRRDQKVGRHAAQFAIALLAAIGCGNARLDISGPDGGSCSTVPSDVFDPHRGLLAHWALDENLPGSIAIDSSGFGSSGTPKGSPLPTADVPPVRFADPFSLSFNGQDQWVEMANPALLNLGGPTTMAAWIRPTAVDGTRDILAHGYRWSPPHDFALRINKGSYMFTTWDSVADHAAIATMPTDDVGKWIHLCGVYDGTGYLLYRNGVLIASTTDSTPPPAGFDMVWAIGGRAPQPTNDTPDYLWQGQIDDVRLYGRALSASEVADLYHR